MRRTPTTRGGSAHIPPWLPWAAGAWALGYGVYRAYYALGGTAGMFGTPVSMGAWYAINAVAAVLLLGAAILPILTRGLWHGPPWRPLLRGRRGSWRSAASCTRSSASSRAS